MQNKENTYSDFLINTNNHVHSANSKSKGLDIMNKWLLSEPSLLFIAMFYKTKDSLPLRTTLKLMDEPLPSCGRLQCLLPLTSPFPYKSQQCLISHEMPHSILLPLLYCLHQHSFPFHHFQHVFKCFVIHLF